MALLHTLDCSTLPLILYLTWVLSKVTSSTIFESLVWLNLGLKPGLPDHWWTHYSLGQYPGKIFNIIVFISKLLDNIVILSNFWSHLMIQFNYLSCNVNSVKLFFFSISKLLTYEDRKMFKKKFIKWWKKKEQKCKRMLLKCFKSRLSTLNRFLTGAHFDVPCLMGKKKNIQVSKTAALTSLKN